MDYKLVATWSAPKPEDEAEFEAYYWDVHVPAAAKVPGMKRFLLTKTSDGLEGSEPAFYRVAELIFDTKEDLLKSSESPEWAAMRDDAGLVIEKYGVSLSMALGTERVWEFD